VSPTCSAENVHSCWGQHNDWSPGPSSHCWLAAVLLTFAATFVFAFVFALVLALALTIALAFPISFAFAIALFALAISVFAFAFALASSLVISVVRRFSPSWWPSVHRQDVSGLGLAILVCVAFESYFHANC